MKTSHLSYIETALVCLLLSGLFYGRMILNPLHTDESYWIATSAYFEDWLSLDTASDSWQLYYYMTLSGPNLPKYLIAVSRLAAGFERADLNLTYNYGFSFEENAELGNIPTQELLLIARIPMTLLAVVLGVAIYHLLAGQSGRLVGALWLFFYASNPMLSSVLLKAMSESSLLFFSVAAALGLVWTQKRWWLFVAEPTRKQRLVVPVLVSGLCIGLAAASKIHAFLLLPMSGLLMLYWCFVAPGHLNRRDRVRHLVQMFSFTTLAALVTFILLNPFLYANPLGGLGLMVKYRVVEMGDQATRYTELATLSLPQRWGSILLKLIREYTALRGWFGLVINGLMLGTGLFVFMRSMLQSLRRRAPLPMTELMILLFLLLIIAAFFSPLDWERYFLFPVFILTLMNTKGVVFLAESLLRLTKTQNRSVTNG